jgi:hypothetical protein
MYNGLEASVARILDGVGIEYKYEKVLNVMNKNGFVSVDFVLLPDQDTFIEVTYWSKPDEKICELKKKWELIKREKPNAQLIVITIPKYMKNYSSLVQKDINVCTLIMLKRHLKKSQTSGIYDVDGV